MKSVFSKSAVIVLLIMSLCLSGCTGTSTKAQEKESVELWFVADEISRKEADALTKQYNDDITLSLVRFASRQEMFRAMEDSMPELLICDELQAESLAKEKKELGWDVPVMVCDTKQLQAAGFEMKFDSLEEFFSLADAYASKTEKPFFALDEAALLIGSAMSSIDKSFHADINADRSDEDFCRVYNMLAEAAFYGSMYAQGGAADALNNGEVPCAVLRLSQLPEVIPDGWRIETIPPLEGGKTTVPGVRYCLVLTGNAGQSAADFMSGFVSAGAGLQSFEDKSEPYGSFREKLIESGALLELSREGELMKNRDSFDAAFAELAARLHH